MSGSFESNGSTLTFSRFTLATGLRAEIAKGTALIDVVTGESDADLPGWLLSQTYHPRNITAAWRELEWE